ncbi:hypothetical protein H7169_01690 [Candidatus Gracilibacteria bacterium]|nr:hypothetical protein [Candidatus Gracilibacteria bacterium]
MKLLSIALALSLLIFPSLSAATVSGEISGKKTVTTPVIVTPKSPTIKYYTGVKGGCYTLVKNIRTGKMIKRYVNKSFCKK